MIIRGGQVLILPASLATPAELAAGVADIEGLCLHVSREYCRHRQIHLDGHAEDDLANYLLFAAWSDAQDYRAGIGTLLGYLSRRLDWRCTDWLRNRVGRSRMEQPVIERLDDADGAVVDEAELDESAEKLGVHSRLGRWTLRHIAMPHADGETLAAIAVRLGMPASAVRAHMDDLRDEIEGGLHATA